MSLVVDAPVEVPDTIPAEWSEVTPTNPEEGALWFVNRVREILGRPPVSKIAKGYPGSDRCPLARSIGPGVRVGNTTIYIGEIGTSLPMPHPAVEFVQNFDRGRLPQYRVNFLDRLIRR